MRALVAAAAAVLLFVVCDTDEVMVDGDGNIYRTVRIGNQLWTLENLHTSSYACGTTIPYIAQAGEWQALQSPGMCYYRNAHNSDSLAKYGAIYNWYVVDPHNPRKIAPEGWRVPTSEDWDTLQDYLSIRGYNWDGCVSANRVAKALAAATSWNNSMVRGATGSDPHKNNKSGFSALSAGYRLSDGNFYHYGSRGYWWTSTEVSRSHAYSRNLIYDYEELGTVSEDKRLGFSVRLVREY